MGPPGLRELPQELAQLLVDFNLDHRDPPQTLR
jgi:hypothetical protein